MPQNTSTLDFDVSRYRFEDYGTSSRTLTEKVNLFLSWFTQR